MTLYSPAFHIGLHNGLLAASDKRFVKQENDSTVFRYDALAEGQRFGGVILHNGSPDLLKELQDLLNNKYFRIGRSRSAVVASHGE